MNCKPGELSFIVSTPKTREAGLDDRVIRVTVLDGVTDRGDRPAWSYEGEYPVCRSGRKIARIGDHILRPIRPDETPEESIEAMRLLTYIPTEVKA